VYLFGSHAKGAAREGTSDIVGIHFERKHDLRYLAELSVHSRILGHRDIFDELTPYAVELRYPGDISAVAKSDAVNLLEKVRLFRYDVRELFDSIP
jgi:predicted nucleotidyltransferase